MNMVECPIAFASLHDTIFLPNEKTGQGINLKANLSTTSTEGKNMGLKMTLMGSMVYIEAKGVCGFFPLTNFKVLVPESKPTNEKNS